MEEKEQVVVKNEEKVEETISYPFIVFIKFEGTKKSYSFGSFFDNFESGDKVVVETVRGLELGEVVGCGKKAEDFKTILPLKPIIRKATKHDEEEYINNKELAKDALKKCEEAVAELGLDMHLIEAEYTLDRSKVIFIYVADERVDFREY